MAASAKSADLLKEVSGCKIGDRMALTEEGATKEDVLLVPA